MDHPSDEKWGKGWKSVKKEFMKQLIFLQKNFGTVFISHHKELQKETAAGQEYTKTVPSLTGSGLDCLAASLDVIMFFDYCVKRKDGREIILSGGKDIEVKNRVSNNHLKNSPTIPAGKNANECYENLMAAWNNTLDDLLEKKEKQRLQKKKNKTNK